MHWHFLVNIAVALALGTAIGIERQWRQHQAGLRTNALVALGATLFVSLTSLMGVQQRSPPISSAVSGSSAAA
jgi:putative Mg2+ transporter-C (MgtC) family protein